MADRPVSRKEKVTGKGKSVKRRGEGLGTGPVGGDQAHGPKSDVPAGKSGEIDAQGLQSDLPEGAQGEGDERDLGSVLQGLNTINQLAGGGNSGGGSALGGLGQLLGGSGGSSNQGNQGIDLDDLGQLLGGNSGGNNGGGGNGGLGGLGSLLGGNGGGNNGGGNGGLGGSSGGGLFGGKGKLILILIVVVLLLGGGGLFSGILGGGNGGGSSNQSQSSQQTGIDLINSLLGGGTGTSGVSGSYGGWLGKANVGELNEDVDPAAADKRTVIKGDGQDTVTLMVYMCGTDLESRAAMGTSDLNEMLQAKTGDKVNVIVMTGGCKNWRNNVISNKTNQIYQIKGGKMARLEDDFSRGSMADPKNLAAFIQYCAKNFPANRNELILWDHGGGSIAGYCYDEKYGGSRDSMDLAEIKSALKAGGVTFDFIGFDACLMATVENGLMLSDYADYMIASEESEPGIGWYYTNWLSKLEADPSMSTLKLGKNIVDDFVAACGQKCPGQATTLSVVDLAELKATAPKQLSAFSTDTSKMIAKAKKEAEGGDYSTVATARTKSREFARGAGIDQVDLIHLAKNLNTKASKALADKLLSAVKYNRTSSNMTNAFGLSVYFPYRSARSVDTMAKVYDQIGMDEDYTKCIQQFAKVETAGQVAGGGSQGGSPFGSLMDILGSSGNTQSYGTVDADAINELIGSFLGGRSMIDGMTKDNVKYMGVDGVNDEQITGYVADNQFDGSKLVWEEAEDGGYQIHLEKDQWDLVTDLAYNLYINDGEGFINMGYDNVFAIDDKGNLIQPQDQRWLAIEDQPVAYYYDYTISDGKTYYIQGHIPVMLNGQRANLIVAFTDKKAEGEIVGATFVYDEEETETQAKNVTEIKKGDKIDFLADYYNYEGKYEDSYMIGDQYVVGDKAPELTSVELDDETYALYRFTDIYHQYHYSQALPKK